MGPYLVKTFAAFYVIGEFITLLKTVQKYFCSMKFSKEIKYPLQPVKGLETSNLEDE
jgi:hypothetical protein